MCQKNKAFKGLDHYAAWPKVADAVIKAPLSRSTTPNCYARIAALKQQVV